MISSIGRALISTMLIASAFSDMADNGYRHRVALKKPKSGNQKSQTLAKKKSRKDKRRFK